MSRPTARRGFSLIEIMIALAILVAVGAIVFVNFAPQKDEADRRIALTQIDGFVDALELFRNDLGRFPSEEEGLSVLWNKGALEEEDDEAKWNGPYMRQPSPEDGWGTPWEYVFPSEEIEGMYKITSAGPDGELDTEDDITSLDRMMNADGELDESFDDFTVDGAGEDSGG